MRLYHAMHSKILYVYRYDKLIQKITFTLSIPIYLGFYVFMILKDKSSLSKKIEYFYSLIKGTTDGFLDALKQRSSIEWPKKGE
jgi:hypothetical protein